MPTITDTISIAKISQYLAQIDILDKGVLGLNVDRLLPRKIYCIRKDVEMLYDLDPTNDTLVATSKYLFSLCAPYSGRAQLILANGQGGLIINPSTGVSATINELRFEFVVGEPGALMSAGDTVLTLSYSNIQSSSILVFLDGTGELPTNRSDRFSYGVVYGVSSTVITFNQAVTNGQLFIIRATQILSS